VILARPDRDRGGGRARLIVALDTADADRAAALAGALAPACGLLKVGLELFAAHGPAAAARVAAAGAASGTPVFLDLKLHDIPNTVAGAVRAVLPLRPAMLTVHAGGGAAMVAAAREAAEHVGGGGGGDGARPAVLAVTVLTSLDAASLAAMGVAGGPTQQVLRLARLALGAGADGLVCSPREVTRLRDAFGAAPHLVVPGVRPAGTAAGDQARVATPEEAVQAGADWIVVGRPITGATDPAAAAAAIAEALPA
jgi:orotidine-5'-phosphate decarboxylase